MRLVFTRELPCTPETAYSLLTDPALMNAWSLARVEVVRRGDGDHPGGAGALRRVRIPGRFGITLEEVVVASDPPQRFSYRVVRGAPVRRHEGVITLSTAGPRTTLRWEVDIELPWPGAARFVRGQLTPSLEASLDHLVALAPRARAGQLPPRRLIGDERAELPMLYEAAEAILADQRARADALLGEGDARGWFTRVYEHVTRLQIEGCRAGRFDHPGWVLRIVPLFHHYYVRALDAPEDTAEAHWARAFRAMRRPERWSEGKMRGVAHAVFQGMRAHIEDDLPRALADVWLDHYQGRCDYVRFRADYLAMSWIFRDAGDRLLLELPRAEKPFRQRALDRMLPAEAKDWWMARSFYDIARKRRQAFERGERLANWHLERQRGRAATTAPVVDLG